MHDDGFLLGAARAFSHDAPGFLLARARAGGGVARFRLAATRAALISDPALVEEVMVARAADFVKPRAMKMARLFFGEALTALDGDEWRARRKIIAPVFQGHAMGDAVAIASRRARAAAARWVSAGAPRRIDREAMALALGTITETLIGADVSGHPGLGASVGLALRGVAVRMQRGWALPDWIPTPSARWMRRGMRGVRAFVDDAVAGGGEGLAARLRAAADASALSPRAVRDELAVSLCLGAHQVALALAWSLHLIATHPDAAARAADEVDAVLGARDATAADLDALRFTRAIVMETLRLYPPFYALVREPTVAMRLGEHELAAGTLVFVSPWVSHRDARWFDAPDQFRPARWLDGLERRLPRFAYFPFGGGPRICPANRMVPAQVVAMLASVMQTGVVRFVPDSIVAPSAAVALGFAHGLPLHVDSRSVARVEVAS